MKMASLLHENGFLSSWTLFPDIVKMASCHQHGSLTSSTWLFGIIIMASSPYMILDRGLGECGGVDPNVGCWSRWCGQRWLNWLAGHRHQAAVVCTWLQTGAVYIFFTSQIFDPPLRRCFVTKIRMCTSVNGPS